jgi:transglutaminase-like putative cysteine protease/predicted glutamine amidotransferase
VPNLLAMCFEGELAPSFDMRCLSSRQTLPDGWGLGYYPAGEPSASVLKEPAPSRGSIRAELVKAWEHLESSLFILHVRTATWGPNTDANTQPFTYAWGGREWMIGHSGSLAVRLDDDIDPHFEPVGGTDTERVFCVLLGRIASRGWRSFGDVDMQVLHGWLLELNGRGALNLILTDGRDLVAYADRSGAEQTHMAELLPPYPRAALVDADVRIDLTRRGSKPSKGWVVASQRLAYEGEKALEWRTLAPGELVVLRQGAVVGGQVLEPSGTGSRPPPKGLPPTRSERRLSARKAPGRLTITHRTTYKYAEQPVERSTHLLRLFPIHDRLQTLLESHVDISVEGRAHDFDDAFGNRARRALLDVPYNELTIEARSRVETLDTDPLSFDLRHVPTAIPLVWMPWQKTMLNPYLQAPELPETELAELVDYGMRFVKRNAGDVLDTLLDLNDAIHREYTYVKGSTTLATTAFDVYVKKRGVCQDFTNLLICLARLLGVPARYVCGYLFTGPKDENRAQAEASHAWLQVYLPEVGWLGLDPTNGVVTSTNHVRLAVGCTYRDATPTSGTIYVGGGSETLDVEVRVDREG